MTTIIVFLLLHRLYSVFFSCLAGFPLRWRSGRSELFFFGKETGSLNEGGFCVERASPACVFLIGIVIVRSGGRGTFFLARKNLRFSFMFLGKGGSVSWHIFFLSAWLETGGSLLLPRRCTGCFTSLSSFLFFIQTKISKVTAFLLGSPGIRKLGVRSDMSRKDRDVCLSRAGGGRCSGGRGRSSTAMADGPKLSRRRAI